MTAGVEDRLTLDLRFLPRSDLARLVNRASAVAYLPFDEDLFGYCTMEAFQAGKPVLTTTDSGGVLDIVRDGETGLVATPDPEALGAALATLADHPERAGRLGRAGREALERPRTELAGDDRETAVVTGLRIGWATPWNANSAIAQAASEVAAELARHGHAITVLRTETGDALSLPPRPSPWPVHALADIPSDHIRHAFDVVVAHVGNNYGYHGALIPRLRDLGAVGIFHDAFLADLAAGWAYLPGGVGEQALRCAVREAYGEDGWRADEPFMIAATVLEVARRRPMLEWLAPHTVAAVAHADHYAARLRAACPGPVEVIPLAMEFHDLPPPPPRWNRMTVAVIGDTNPNKRIDQVILAVAASPVLRRCCRIRVIGGTTEEVRERLSAYARTLEIQPPEFTGWVSDEELRWQLRDVDVICCLRYPVLEGARRP